MSGLIAGYPISPVDCRYETTKCPISLPFCLAFSFAAMPMTCQATALGEKYQGPLLAGWVRSQATASESSSSKNPGSADRPIPEKSGWPEWAPSTHWSKQGRRWKAATEIPQLHSGHSPPQTRGHYLPVGMLLPLQPLNLVLPPYRPLPCYGSQFSQIVGLSSDSRQLGLATHWRVPLSHPRVLLWN